LPENLKSSEIVLRDGWPRVKQSAAEFLNEAVQWLEENCGDFPMMKWSWADRNFGTH
jgi:hypothetical protein